MADESSDMDFNLTPEFLIRLERFCASGTAGAVGSLGMELMPLLRMLDREFKFDLPLDAIEQHFRDRARNENVQ